MSRNHGHQLGGPAETPVDRIERELDNPVLFVDTGDAADGHGISAPPLAQTYQL
jgi:hypothetical protein